MKKFALLQSGRVLVLLSATGSESDVSKHRKSKNAGRKGRREDDEGRDGVGSLMGVGSLLNFWEP